VSTPLRLGFPSDLRSVKRHRARIFPYTHRRVQRVDPALQAGQFGDDHAVLDQSRHHRPQVCPAVPARWQGNLFPHGDDRCLPGPEHGELFAQKLKVKKVFIIDDTGAYGVGIADAFEAQARKDGMNVLGHDQVNPLEADYRTILTKIKGIDPEALYYGGSC
jgi:hypothetical protein